MKIFLKDSEGDYYSLNIINIEKTSESIVGAHEMLEFGLEDLIIKNYFHYQYYFLDSSWNIFWDNASNIYFDPSYELKQYVQRTIKLLGFA